jgi:hypothetical protein
MGNVVIINLEKKTDFNRNLKLMKYVISRIFQMTNLRLSSFWVGWGGELFNFSEGYVMNFSSREERDQKFYGTSEI